jgi:hypothetical protein
MLLGLTGPGACHLEQAPLTPPLVVQPFLQLRVTLLQRGAFDALAGRLQQQGAAPADLMEVEALLTDPPAAWQHQHHAINSATWQLCPLIEAVCP